MTDVSVLEVLLHDAQIGTLTNVGGDRTLFAFNNDYVADEDRPTLGLSFKDQFGVLIEDYRPYQTRVMPFFSNLLPEGELRRYLAQISDIKPEREYFLLKALGNDLPGAVTLRPADIGNLAGHSEFEKPTDNQSKSVSSDQLRFSLAGVQLKFSAVENSHGGLTIPASGIGGSWIVKLPSREYEGVPENEYSMMTLAALIGMNVPDIDLVDIASIENIPRGTERLGAKAFIIKRFDRHDDGSKVHIEDFAQVFNVFDDEKYKKARMRNIATVIGAEGSEGDLRELIRRLVFNALIGNGDMHLKNWSLIYPSRRNASLSPAYDFVSTIPYLPDDQQALKVSRSKAFADFDLDELEHMSVRAALPLKLVQETTQETVALFHEHWEREKLHLPMHNDVRDIIDSHIPKVPIASLR